MKMKKRGLTILLGAMLLVSACGSGGGSAPNAGGNPAAQPTHAVVKIATTGALSSGTQIGGIDITLNLPTGVSVASSPDSGNPSVLVTDAGKVTASGVAAGANTNTLATYVPAMNSAPGRVVLHVADPNGFGVGEFVTIDCDISAGHNPAPADFSTSGFYATDLNGVPLSTLAASLSAVMQ